MSTNFVDATGFHKKTLATIKTEIETALQSVFGTAIDLDPSGPFGQLVGILSQREADMWDGAEEIYNSRDPSQTTGVSLDNISAETGIIRKAATATVVNGVELTGTAGTIIAAGKQIRQPNSELTFSLLEAVTLDGDGEGTGNFQCDSLGANTIAAETLTEIVTPVTGWDTVSNPDPGVTGLDIETDSDLRIRRSTSSLSGNATEEAIRSAILNEVEGVSSVKVMSNRTMTTNIYDMPAKSFECVVVGGTDQDVADKIWEKMPEGIEPYGNTEMTVTDSQGQSQTVSFSRPVPKYAWVRVSRALYSEETYPADGDTLIKDAIVAWALTQYSAGTDLIPQRLSRPIYEIDGIGDILIEVAVTDDPGGSPSYSEADIPISIREVLEFATSRITVQDLT